ncbi:hypothetical protein CHARACLAT_030669 [Characodon lateralis]|uniref:Uncharacterized protein n=1 Tax=Characodon lateralis TaxID=208331 RepID=A0ABU7CVN3_9TELE|nr:hypothetical protein [Characodon lateralis]
MKSSSSFTCRITLTTSKMKFEDCYPVEITGEFLCSWYCVVQSQCCTTVPDRTLLCSESDCCATYTKLY